jgi:hypothetical protein
MAMDHPHSCILHAEPPTAPPGVDTGRCLCAVTVEEGGVPEDGVVVGEFLLVFDGVVGSVAGTDVVAMSAVEVPGVEVDAAVVVDEGAGVLEDDFEDLMKLSVWMCHSEHDGIFLPRQLSLAKSVL